MKVRNLLTALALLLAGPAAAAGIAMPPESVPGASKEPPPPPQCLTATNTSAGWRFETCKNTSPDEPDREPATGLVPANPEPGHYVEPSWSNAVVQRLKEYTKYPDGAASRNEEGVVKLNVLIGRTGKVLSSQIAVSSGHPELDEEAMSIIKRAQPLPPFPITMQQLSLSFTIPVTFSLHQAATSMPTTTTPAPAPEPEAWVFQELDHDTGCHSPYSEQKRDDMWTYRWKGRTVWARGEIVGLPEGTINLKVYRSTLTMDLSVVMRDPAVVYNLEIGQRVVVRFEPAQPGGCFLPAIGHNGEYFGLVPYQYR